MNRQRSRSPPTTTPSSSTWPTIEESHHTEESPSENKGLLVVTRNTSGRTRDYEKRLLEAATLPGDALVNLLDDSASLATLWKRSPSILWQVLDRALEVDPAYDNSDAILEIMKHRSILDTTPDSEKYWLNHPALTTRMRVYALKHHNLDLYYATWSHGVQAASDPVAMYEEATHVYGLSPTLQDLAFLKQLDDEGYIKAPSATSKVLSHHQSTLTPHSTASSESKLEAMAASSNIRREAANREYQDKLIRASRSRSDEPEGRELADLLANSTRLERARKWWKAQGKHLFRELLDNALALEDNSINVSSVLGLASTDSEESPGSDEGVEDWSLELNKKRL